MQKLQTYIKGQYLHQQIDSYQGMENQSEQKQLHILKDYLAAQGLQFESRKKQVSLDTFAHCIFDVSFILPSSQKLKFFNAYKSKIIQSIFLSHKQGQQKSQKQQKTTEQKPTRIGISNILCHLTFMVSQKRIFLANEKQWQSFIQLLLKIMLGKFYTLSSNFDNKYVLLKKFILSSVNSNSAESFMGSERSSIRTVETSFKSKQQNRLTEKEQLLEKQINLQSDRQNSSFISGLISSGIFRELFCNSTSIQDFGYLFQLFFVVLVHSYAKKFQLDKTDIKIFQSFINTMFMTFEFNPENIQFYFKLLNLLIRYYIKQINEPLTSLILKVTTDMLILKLGQLDKSPQNRNNKKILQQVEKIKQKLGFVLKLNDPQMFYKYLKQNQQSHIGLVNLAYNIKACALLQINWRQILNQRFDFQFNQESYLAIFHSFNTLIHLSRSSESFAYANCILAYIKQVKLKVQCLSSTTLHFTSNQSVLSMIIPFQCEISIKLKIPVVFSSIVLFEFFIKNRKILILQKELEDRKTKFVMVQFSKNDVKQKQSPQITNFRPVEQFSLNFDKSKIIFSFTVYNQDKYRRIKLFEFQKFDGIGSKFSIGSSQPKQDVNVEQVQKFIVTKAEKKSKGDNTNSQKIDLLKVMTNNITNSNDKKEEQIKTSQIKKFAFEFKKLSTVQYPKDFRNFALRHNIKDLLLKIFENLISKYFSSFDNQCYKSKQSSQSQILINKSFESKQIKTNQINVFDSINNLLESIEEHDKIIWQIVNIVVLKLQKIFDGQGNPEEKNILFNYALQFFKYLDDIGLNIVNNLSSFTANFMHMCAYLSLQTYFLLIDCFISRPETIKQLGMNYFLPVLQQITFQSILIVQNDKIISEQKQKLISRTSKLQAILRQMFQGWPKIDTLQKETLQKMIIFLIEVLKSQKYDNRSNLQSKKIKIAAIHIRLIESCYSLIDKEDDLEQQLGSIILNLCTKKVHYLKQRILQDEKEAKEKIMQDTEVKFQDSCILMAQNKNQQGFQVLQEIEELPVDQLKSNQHVHHILYNKLNIFEKYIGLYFSIIKIQGKKTLEKLPIVIQQFLKPFNAETMKIPSLFYQILLRHCWQHFLESFMSHVKTSKDGELIQVYILMEPTIKLLSDYGFEVLSNDVVKKILNLLLFHPYLLLSPQINWQLQVRLNSISDFSSDFLQTLRQIRMNKMFQIPKFQSNIAKSITILIFRTIFSDTALFNFQITILQSVILKESLLSQIKLLVLARQLSSQQIRKYKSNEQSKYLFDYFLKNLSNYEKKMQVKMHSLKGRNQGEFSMPLELAIGKLQKLRNYLQAYQTNLQNDPILQFDPNIFKNSQILQLLQQQMGKVVRKLQVQYEQQKVYYLERQKKKSGATMQPQPKKDMKKNKRSMQIAVQNLQNSDNGKKIKTFGSDKILLNHIQNLFKRINEVQSLLTCNSLFNQISWKQEKIVLNSQNLNEMDSKYRQYEYSIDQYCDSYGFKPLLKFKQVCNELPKMKDWIGNNKRSQKGQNSFLDYIKYLRFKTEDYQKNLLEGQQFLPLRIYNEMPMSPNYRAKQRQVGKYIDSFSVTHITSSQFIQGQLRVYSSYLCEFIQNKQIDVLIYKELQALKSEQRNKSQIIKSRTIFKIKFQRNQASYIKKSYLKVDNSIEIYTLNKSYFFVFRSQKERDMFTTKVYPKAALIPEHVEMFAKCWQKGIVSNFDYLMHLNRYAQRSFNDISQYYVFPWTVTQYKQKKMSEDFFKTPQNFRDLTKPIGKINATKFNNLKTQFQNAKRFFDSDRPKFLYGSFYSNPAIVSYYMIRIHPFSAHQYELQNYRFDHPDRLFGSVQKNYDAVYNITGDFKELIPEFYSNPFFLKNRNRYNLGTTQSKVLIDDVQLPHWVRTKTPEQFIFRMRKCLESQIVTLSLHKWIDLTFGICSSPRNAEKYDNLYNQNVYGIEKSFTQSKNLSFCNKYLKEFGQVPRVILQNQHPKSLMKPSDTKRLLKKSKSITDMLKQQLIRQDIKEFTLKQCQKLNEETEVGLIKITGKQIKERKLQSNKNKAFLEQVMSPRSLAYKNYNNFEPPQISNEFLILKENCIVVKNCYGLGCIFPEDNKDPSEYKNKPDLSSIEKFDFLTIDDKKKLQTYFLTIQNNQLYGHRFITKMFKSEFGQKFLIQTAQEVKLLQSIGSFLILINKDNQVKFYTTQTQPLSQKKLPQKQKIKQSPSSLLIQSFVLTLVKTIKLDVSGLTDIYSNSHLSLICLKSKANQFFVFDVREDMDIKLRTRFEVAMMYDQAVQHVLTHNMGYILVLTTKNRLLFYNLLGQPILNVMISFAPPRGIQIPEYIKSVCFWSQESSQIVFSTNKLLLYKIDIFDMAERRTKIQNTRTLPIDQFQIFTQPAQQLFERYEFKQCRQKIVDIKLQRRGRHWKMYCLTQKGNIYTLKNRYFDITRYVKIVLRQRED